MIYQSMTDTGKVRNTNQDNFSNHICKEHALFVVADGMGGYKGGEIASEVAVNSIRDYMINTNCEGDYATHLVDAVLFANSEVIKRANEDPSLKSMGSTVVCALMVDDTVFVSHLGDSRLYHHSDKKLKQITVDDSYVQKLKETGIELSDSIEAQSLKNWVTKALGGELYPEVSTYELKVKPGDYLVLTSDGLTNMVDDEEIEEVLNLDLEIKEATEILVYMANSSGGHDNITITLVKI